MPTEIKYNNQAGQLGTDPGTGPTITFATAPNFQTLGQNEYIKLALDQGKPTYEIVYLTSYAQGAVTGSISRGAEDSSNWPVTAHPAGTWVCAPTSNDFTSGSVSNVGAADSSITVTGTGDSPLVSRSALVGDVTVPAGSNSTTVVGSANVESIVRANSLDQLAPPVGNLNINSQKLTQVANGTLIADAMTTFQASGCWISEAGFGWTRVSNTQFTIATNRSFFYTPGTKLLWQESSTSKFGVVANSNWNGTVTTVNLMPTTDYVMAASPDNNSNNFGTGSPQGFPSNFSWTPVDTGFSAEPTYVQSWWSVQRGLCFLNVLAVAGGTSNATTLTITAPIACNGTNGSSVIIGVGLDNGTATGTQQSIANGTTTISVTKFPGGAAFTASGSKSTSFQMTYAI